MKSGTAADPGRRINILNLVSIFIADGCAIATLTCARRSPKAVGTR
jgi:hypothetical protein